MRYQFQSGEHVYEITIERQGKAYQAAVDGEPFSFVVLEVQPGQISLEFEGRPLTLYWAVDGSSRWVSQSGCTYRLDKPVPRAARPTAEPGGGQAIRAPMPAQVRAVQVEEGDIVQKGQTLLLLEAMKMEIRIKAPTNGTVKRLLVIAGQTVEKEQTLAEVIPAVE